MSYLKEVVDLAAAIRASAERIQVLEKARRDWNRPNGHSIWLGENVCLTHSEGVTPPKFVALKQEILKVVDDQIFSEKSRFEGLRFKLVNAAKAGGWKV